jgi:hypothetical protein
VEATPERRTAPFRARGLLVSGLGLVLCVAPRCLRVFFVLCLSSWVFGWIQCRAFFSGSSAHILALSLGAAHLGYLDWKPAEQLVAADPLVAAAGQLWEPADQLVTAYRLVAADPRLVAAAVAAADLRLVAADPTSVRF